MTAPLEELHRAYPEAELHVAVHTRWAPLLESHPFIHKVWTYERHKEKTARAKAIARLALNLRKQRFDTVINFHASPSSATIAFATGAKTRSIHFHGHRDKNRYSTVPIPGKGILKPVIERDMDAVRALGIHVPPGRTPKIHLQKIEIDRAREWLAQAGLVGESQGPLLGLGLGASRPTKCWPVERFAALAIHWCERENGGVLVPLGPEDDSTLHAFLKALDDQLSSTLVSAHDRAALRKRIVVEKNIPVRKLASLQSQLGVFAGNDSGPKHLAIAVGTPTVTLFGPEDPFEWHPYSREEHPILHIEHLACRRDAQEGMPPWCGLNICTTERHRCMRDIGIDEVLATCKRTTRRRP